MILKLVRSNDCTVNLFDLMIVPYWYDRKYNRITQLQYLLHLLLQKQYLCCNLHRSMLYIFDKAAEHSKTANIASELINFEWSTFISFYIMFRDTSTSVTELFLDMVSDKREKWHMSYWRNWPKMDIHSIRNK